MVQLRCISRSSGTRYIAVRSICKRKVSGIVITSWETCVNMCRWQVAQTVGHVMLDHMSFSGVMHGDGRWHGEEMMKHEVKKRNISTVHTQYHNNVFIAGGGAITWRLKKQATIALSSTEAEYVALSKAMHEAFWLRNLYAKLRFNQKKPTLIRGDNDGSIVITQNPLFDKRSKHIAIRWHWIQDQV